MPAYKTFQTFLTENPNANYDDYLIAYIKSWPCASQFMKDVFKLGTLGTLSRIFNDLACADTQTIKEFADTYKFSL